MFPSTFLRFLATGFVASLFCSCASVSVSNVGQTASAKPAQKPPHFYVAPFSTVGAQIKEHPMRKQPGSLGPEAQELLSKFLVAELNKSVGPASAVSDKAMPGSSGWLITGQFTRLNEGSRILRMAIGLGAGGTKMETKVAVRNLTGNGAPFLNFATSGGSGAQPGAATNPIPFSSAPTALMASKNGITDDADRTARMIVATVADYMVKRGWMEPGKVAKPKMMTQ